MAKEKKAGSSATLVQPEVKELKQSVERLQALIEEAPIGICNTDLKGKVTYVNKRFKQVSGYSREEVVGKNGLKLGMFPNETLKLLGKRMKDRLMGKPPRLLETQFKCKDGHWIWVTIEGKPMREKGIPVGFQLIARDITERKQMEEALRASEERYHHLFENLNDAAFIADAETGQILETNRQGEVLLGMSCNEILGMHQSALHPPGKAEEYRQRFAAHIAKGHAADYDGEVIRKDGTIIPVSIGALPLTINGRHLILGLFHDITGRRQAEEMLRESQEALRQMFESVTDGIAVIDLNGVVTEVNQRTVEIHGFSSKDELLGKSAFEFVAPRDHKKIATNMRQALKQGTIKGVEYTLLKADGSEFPGELSTSVLKDASGNLVGHITVVRDITKRKQAREALQESEAYLKTTLNSIPTGIVVIDLETHQIVDANPVAVEMVGVPKKQVIGSVCHKYICPAEKGRCPITDLGQVVDNSECVLLNANGERIPILKSVVPITRHGRQYLLELMFDITERKRVEEELKLRAQILDGATDSIFLHDFDGNFVYVNEAACRTHGYSREEFMKMKLHQVIAPERVSRLDSDFQEMLEKGQAIFESAHLRKDGSIMPAEVHGRTLESGRKKLLLTVIRDVTERKRMEEALRESQKFSSSLLENSPNPIFVINPDTSVRYVNPAFEKLTGFTLAEIAGRKAPYPWWPEEQREEMTAAFKNAMVTGGRRSERIFQKKNGEHFWVALNSAPVVHNGELIYFLINWLDITERKQAGEALREAEEKYKNLVEAISDMIWETDEEGTFTFVSPRIKDTLGYEANEVVGKRRTLDFTPKEEARKWLKLLKEINAKKKPFSGFEITHLHKNGNPVVFETSGIPFFDNAGNFKGFVGINKDITEHKRVEEELRESQKFSSSLLENSPNPIHVINPDTSVTYVNPAFEKLTGFTLAEIAGRKAPYPWWPEEQGEEITAGLKNAMAHGGRRSERIFQKKNGERFWIALNSAPVVHNGKLIYFLINWLDITERKRMEEERRELEQKAHLASRLASVGEMASGIAHEINNPLTAVIGFAQLLMDTNLPDEVKEDVGVIYEEAQRAAGVAKNLLTFARKHTPVKQLTNMNDIIDGVLKLRAYEQRVNNIQVDTQFAPKLPQVMADYSQMEQVFLNIIINAETAMLEANKGGTLSITTQKVNDTIRASFTDDGPGIDKENLEHVFDPFFTTKEVGKGTGLGLSVCHGIVVEHGGRIYARSKLGRGATFVVELPIDAH